MTRRHPAQPYIRQAEDFRLRGRLPEAAAVYAGLLTKWPDLPDSWYNLALIQRQLGRFDEALASYRQALDRGASSPEEVHLNRGVIYSDHLRRDAEAEAELETALKLNPNYVPALLNLANLREQHGNKNAALALYERILTHDRRCHEALARFASLRSAQSAQDPLVDDLRQAISVAAAPDDKASLGFALGKILNDCAAYDDAFEAFAAANRCSRQSAVRMAPYDQRRHERYIDDIMKAFPSSAQARETSTTEAPIFICGMFRSGSTLVEQVLASHPNVTSGGELNLIPALAHSDFAPFPAAMAQASTAKLANAAERYRNRVAQMFPSAKRLTDKRPDNFLYVGLIKALFPNARIVNTVRNPLDNCLSVYFLHLDHGMPYALDLMDTAHYYRQYRRLTTHWKSLFGPDIFDFDYDEFVRDPRPVAERLLAFCGLEWDDACLSFHRTKNPVRTESVWQVREPLYQRASGRWHHYAKHLDQVRAYLADLEAR